MFHNITDHMKNISDNVQVIGATAYSHLTIFETNVFAGTSSIFTSHIHIHLYTLRNTCSRDMYFAKWSSGGSEWPNRINLCGMYTPSTLGDDAVCVRYARLANAYLEGNPGKEDSRNHLACLYRMDQTHTICGAYRNHEYNYLNKTHMLFTRRRPSGRVCETRLCTYTDCDVIHAI